jgi:hypothetical protein
MRKNVRVGVAILILAAGFCSSPNAAIAASDDELLDVANYPTVSRADFKNIHPKKAVDSVSFVVLTGNERTPESDKPIVKGLPCRRAKKKSVCLAKYTEAISNVPEVAWPDDFHMQIVESRYLVVTRGDEVFAPSTTDTSFFGEIDTATEAAWVARSVRVRSEKGTFVAFVEKIVSDCPIKRDLQAVVVNRNATLSIRARRTVEQQACI